MIDRQTYNATFNIDVYAPGVSEVAQGGQLFADEQSSRASHRAARLVRNIIMSDTYVTLGYPKPQIFIGLRNITQIQSFQPEFIRSFLNR